MAMIHARHVTPHTFPLAPLSSALRRHPPILFASRYPLFFGARQQSAPASVLRPLIVELSEQPSTPTPVGDSDEEGPIEIPSSSPSSIFAIDDSPTPLQTAASIVLTGSITVFLFRSLRRRAKRLKELRVRSTGVTKVKDLKGEAFESLKAIGVGPVESKGPPSPVQAFLGGIVAGVIAVLLYKFTTTVEASLNRQAISDSFSVRQLTITIRTIINGLCYLATFAFGINSIGLVLYSVQLAFSSVMEGTSNKSSTTTGEEDQRLDSVDPSNTSIDENNLRKKGFLESSDES